MKHVRTLAAVLVLMLALNFCAVAGLAGWLIMSGKLNTENIAAMREVLFPPEKIEEIEPVSDEPVPEGPLVRLEELLSSTMGMSTGEQLEVVRGAIDRHELVMQQQRRELEALQRQIELAQAKIARDRAAVEAQQQSLDQREKLLTTRIADKGFDQTLKVYNALATKQVKEIFSQMTDDVVVRYLRAMDPRRASRVLSEFKTPEEIQRAQSLLELMRKPEAPAGADASNALQANR